MPLVEVQYLAAVADLAGVRRETVQVNGNSLAHLIEALLVLRPGLVKMLDDTGGPGPGYLVFLNGRDVRLEGWMSAELHEGDAVGLMTAIGGGDV